MGLKETGFSFWLSSGGEFMPIFEYVCEDCGKKFEMLIRGNETPECPKCSSKKVKKLLSRFNSTSSGQSSSSGSSCCSCSGGNCSTCK